MAAALSLGSYTVTCRGQSCGLSGPHVRSQGGVRVFNSRFTQAISLSSTSSQRGDLRWLSRGPWRSGVADRGMARRSLVATASVESTEEKKKEKIPFGYTRKDVILIGVGITVFGVALKWGLEASGLMDPLQAGNVVQLFVVMGLMLGWISTYIFRVGGKQMTYVQQLKDYEDAVMKKRMEEMPDGELESMLAEVEEEKRRLIERRSQRRQQ